MRVFVCVCPSRGDYNHNLRFSNQRGTCTCVFGLCVCGAANSERSIHVYVVLVHFTILRVSFCVITRFSKGGITEGAQHK